MTDTPERPELRIALAMRGGVSLAVWMGGACSEVDALRRAQVDKGGSLYEQVLEASGYGSVAVDVVAGASAGGLNGVLMSCSVVYGIPFRSNIRDLWLKLGDIGVLARDAELGTPVSVLDGDGRFFQPLLNVLKAETDKIDWAKRGVGPEPRLDLSLTGTLFSSRRSERFQDLGPAIDESRNRARFRFRHLPGPDGTPDTDFFLSTDAAGAHGSPGASPPPAGHSPSPPVLARLAYAARATSSFPGVFEPASVGYAEDSATPDDGPLLPPTHFGVYSESRPGEGPSARDYVIDGGVLDNIPVAWAIRSIAAAPADRKVDRWLVYLQPVPFKPPETDPGTRPGMRDTIKRAKSLQAGTETLSEDIDELQRLQSDSLRREGFQQVLEYALGQLTTEDGTSSQFLDALFRRALASALHYRLRTGVLEADRLRRLWTDPLSILGNDPLGFTELGAIPTGGADRSPLMRNLRIHGCHEGVLALGEAQDAVDVCMTTSTPAHLLAELGKNIRTPQAMARTIAVLLDCARELGDPALDIKRTLYNLRSRIELLVARHDRRLAAEPLESLGEHSPTEIARRASWRLDHPNLLPEAGWPEEPFNELWEALVAQARAVASVAPTDAPPRALIGCLVGAAAETGDPVTATHAVLVAVELLSGPLRPDPFSESSRVRFHMLSALNQSPVPRLNGLSVEDKLAGDQIKNFGAFLSARWRLNDWIWGRLDAARSLVEIVTGDDPDRKAQRDFPMLRSIAGVTDEAGLPVIVEALVGKLHEEILREELPLFGVLEIGPPTDELLANVVPSHGALDVEPLLQTGRASVWDVLRVDLTRWGIASKLGFGGGRAWTADLADSLADGVSSVAGKAAGKAKSVAGNAAGKAKSAAGKAAGNMGRAAGKVKRAAGRVVSGIRRKLPFV